MNKTKVIIEALDLSEAQINAEQRTVRQRLIVAGESANKRVYADTVLQRAASLFEGAKAYANHPTNTDLKERPERSIRDVTGWLSNIVFENNALWATRHFTRTQAGQDAWSMVQDIVEGRAPATLMGASIHAIGKGKSDNGRFIVESIEAVNSVDDVTTPAAGGGFFHESAGDDLTNQLLEAMTFEEFFASRPDYIKRIQHEMKTTRQDDALKAVNTVAEERQQALSEAQTQLNTLTDTNARLTAANEQLRRELAIVEALRVAKLPETYDTDLRERLPKIHPSEWAGIISIEKKKAQKQGGKQPVPVTGAAQQVQSPYVHTTPMPESLDMSRVETPEDLRRQMQRLHNRS